MTIEVTSYFSGPYITNGATTVFPFSFISMDADELGVLLRDADGADTVVSTSLYSVTRAADGTGSVVFSSAPASGSDLYIFSDVSFAQSVDFEDGSGWKAAPVNSVADRSAARDIWLKGALGRALLAPLGETMANIPSVDNRLGKFLSFDAEGNPVAADGTGPDGGLRSDLAASTGGALVGLTGGISIQSYVNAFASDLGAASLQAAITSGAGKRVVITRAWTLTAAVTIPADTEVVLLNTVTQSTNATSIFIVTANNVTIRGRGLLTGTNTETATTCAIEATGADYFTVDGIVLKNARYGIGLLGGCTDYRLLNNLFYGAVAETGGGNSADIFCYGSSGNRNNRGLISGNFCLGNNDNGINVNANNGDDEFTIVNNFVIPCDSSGISRRSNATTTRRFGIIVSYVGGSDGQRQVIGNTVWGAAYAGFYSAVQTAPSGHTVWSDNIAIGCGFGMSLYDGTDTSLRAGYLFQGGGFTTGSGNKAISCYTAGLKIVGSTLFSAANGQRVSFSGFAVHGTIDPTITAAAARGVFITGTPNNIYIGDLEVVHSGTGEAIYYDTTSTDSGGVVFDGGRVTTAGAAGAFQVAAAVAGTDSAQPVTIQNMQIMGSDNTTNNQFNSGIWHQGNVIMRGNTIKKYHRAVNSGDTVNTRRIDRVVDGNIMIDCAIGLNGAGTGTVLAQNNRYVTCTTNVNGVYIEGKLFGTSIQYSSAGIPTAGSFAQGDIAWNATIAAAGRVGWGRATTGTGHVSGTDWLPMAAY